MKIRTGFVSNSSSSSFVCQICGGEVSGMDMTLSEAEMVRCVHQHLFCSDHVLGDFDDRYNLPATQCPICQLQVLTDEDYMAYMSKMHLNKKETLEIIKANYGSYEKFKQFLEE